MSRIWSSMLVLLVLLWHRLCGRSTAQGMYNFTCDLSPEQHNKILQEAIIQFQKENFSVVEGVMRFVYPKDGQFAANPSTPYGLYMFDKQLPIWKLEEMDAIVFFGCTPPPAKYFSFRSYVVTEYGNLLPKLVFASLGDSTNNLVINTTGLTANNPFGKTAIVTTTADMNTDLKVREAFTAAGVPATVINTDIIPSALVKMGNKPFADTFNMLYRVAVFQEHSQGQAYLNTTWPILRVSPPPQQSPFPFSTPPLRKRGTGTTEISYSASFSAFMNQVNETIIKGSVNYSVTHDQFRPVHLEGYECIKTFTNCLGDNRQMHKKLMLPTFRLDAPILLNMRIENSEQLRTVYVHNNNIVIVHTDRDAAYMNTSRWYKLGAGETDRSFFIVCGLNHVKTGKATYINFAVGSVIAVDDSEFGESARKYAPKLQNVDMFYAYKVARKCDGESYCLEISTNTIAEDKNFNFIARAYLEPSTKVGPDGAELLMPYVLYYTPG